MAKCGVLMEQVGGGDVLLYRDASSRWTAAWEESSDLGETYVRKNLAGYIFNLRFYDETRFEIYLETVAAVWDPVEMAVRLTAGAVPANITKGIWTLDARVSSFAPRTRMAEGYFTVAEVR